MVSYLTGKWGCVFVVEICIKPMKVVGTLIVEKCERREREKERNFLILGCVDVMT